MPVVALVGVLAAAAAVAAGRHDEAAELLGAAARLRGGDDATNPDVAAVADAARAALGDATFASAYERGRALDREAAVARLAPAWSGTATVGP
jgi:hypothetical protein